MNNGNKLAGDIEESYVDPVMAAALENFKTSVNAWSEAAANSLPRTAVITARVAASNKRIAASWALAGVLATSILAGGLYERHREYELGRIAAAKAAQQEAMQEAAQKLDLTKNAPEQRVAATIVVTKHRSTAVKSAAANDAELLATVDSDVSRQVPAAMEPLAQMMDSNGTN